MRGLLLLAAICGVLTGCSTPPKEFRAVWTQREWPPAEWAAPAGFSVTPRQAYEIVRETPWTLSLKHVWHLHADGRYYYVHDTFGGDGAFRAFQQGVRVDGRTGEIVKR